MMSQHLNKMLATLRQTPQQPAVSLHAVRAHRQCHFGLTDFLLTASNITF